MYTDMYEKYNVYIVWEIQCVHAYTWSEHGINCETCLYIECMLYMHVCTWFITFHPCMYVVHTCLYMVHLCSSCWMSVYGSSWFILVLLFLLKTFPWGMLFVPRLYSAVPALDNALEQESAIWYRQGSYRYVPPKNGSGWWVAFLWLVGSFVQTCI